MLNCRFEFQKRRQLFIRTHNETLSVVAVCIDKSAPKRACHFAVFSGTLPSMEAELDGKLPSISR